MYRLALAALCVVVVASACSTADDNAVASLTDVAGTADAAEDVEPDVTTVEAVLAFAACMRENGIEDFADPEVGADGSISFQRGAGALVEVDRETLEAARDACGELLEQAGIGPGSVDRSEIEDQLVAFAACMRENGIDMPDPDFSSEPGQGGPFAGEIDPSDPEFAAAMEACQELFGGRLVPGGGPGGGPGRGGGSAGGDA